MVKRVLMVAYHYPPLFGGSGIHRTQAFAAQLPQFGWQPLILTVHPRAYEQVAGGGDVANTAITVQRSFALDSSRHLAWRGRYPDLLAQPDRWISWCLGGVPAGLSLIHRYRPNAIWSTYPIATAHLIALSLHRLSGLPWLVDQRDPLIDQDYPPDPRRRRIHAWIERQAMQRAAAVVCTTPGAAHALRQRHAAGHARIALIENGYDEAAFASSPTAPNSPLSQQHRYTLLHSGVIYPSERDPAPLLEALARLHNAGVLVGTNFRLLLRASAHDDYLRRLIARHRGLELLVELAPALPYPAALAEMLNADGLLLLQAASCNQQIPAKLYEYLRARRPLLALTDSAGDTARLLRQLGIDTIAQLDQVSDIVAALSRFLRLCQRGVAPLAPPAALAGYSRLARTHELAALLNHLTLPEPPCTLRPV